MANVIKVFTNDSLHSVLKLGGSGYWKLNAERAKKCAYVVLVRNPDGKDSESSVKPRTAFLIGKITTIVPSKDRFVIAFDEYAEINVPDAWDGSRNPVGYSSLSELDLNANKLKWIKVDALRPTPEAKPAEPMTIDQAKRGIAAALGISHDQIEINIRA